MKAASRMNSLALFKPSDLSLVDPIKSLADRHRNELGFHSRQSFVESFQRRQVFIATDNGEVVGFVRYHHRKDGRTTLYEIATSPEYRGQDIGRKLITTLVAECRERFACVTAPLSCGMACQPILSGHWLCTHFATQPFRKTPFLI